MDIGGTKIGVVLLDAQGKVVDEHRHPTIADEGPDGVIKRMVECGRECFADAASQIIALGVGVAGQVDARSGAVTFAPNLDWHNIPLRAELTRELGYPVTVVNDVRAATWGERIAGAGKRIDDLVVLFVGTGIGGGVVSAGSLLLGATNSAGELGHTTLVAGGRRCRCGHAGCMEAYAGGWGIAARAQDAVRADPAAGAALLKVAGRLEELTAEMVAEAYRNGDALATRLVKETGEYLAAGTVSLVNAFNPSRLILGGGVLDGLPELLTVVDTTIRQEALAAAVTKLDVVLAKLGSSAPAIGAAALARAALAR
jgi:glucokinase